MDNNKILLFLGDVVPYKSFKFRNDLQTVINLECPIIKGGIPEEGKINLKVSENYLAAIFGENLLCVNIGNNHILDYGTEGVDSTLNELNGLKIPYFGLSSSSDSSYCPLIINKAGINIAFISAVCSSTSPLVEVGNTYKINELEEDALIHEISRIRPLVTRLVVYIHWGTEESSYPNPRDILIARRLIDNGVDIVIGSHAHAPQPVERYGNGIIAYNLGNFIMPSLKDVPSYYSENGEAQSTYNKKKMLWNRISWGVAINLEDLNYKVVKYMPFFNRIVRLPITPLDRYLKMRIIITDESYSSKMSRHLKRRALYRYIMDFIQNPHVPQKLKRIL
ncbi:MAG: CapA family protein [Prolixibacteraceae bacterium]|nr:CapA family protein [Prolixibacteraceae bacterium]